MTSAVASHAVETAITTTAIVEVPCAHFHSMLDAMTLKNIASWNSFQIMRIG